MAGADDTSPEQNMEDPDTMVNNGVGIPKDPTVLAATQGTGVAGGLPLGIP